MIVMGMAALACSDGSPPPPLGPIRFVGDIVGRTYEEEGSWVRTLTHVAVSECLAGPCDPEMRVVTPGGHSRSGSISHISGSIPMPGTGRVLVFGEPIDGGVRLSGRSDTVIVDLSEHPVDAHGNRRACRYGLLAWPATWPSPPVAPELFPGGGWTFEEVVDCLIAAP